MGIDLVVSSLAGEWSHYSDEARELHASLDRLVPYGEARPPYDPAFGARAFCEASWWRRRFGEASAHSAVQRFQDALSARFDRALSWQDPPELDELFGQIDPQAALGVNEIVERAGAERFPNLAILDIQEMYLPVELPTVLIGQPRSIGSTVALAREITAVRGLVGDDERMQWHLDLLHDACVLALERSGVLILCG